MGEPLDLALAPHQLALLLDEQLAQGVGVQMIEIGGPRHGRIMPEAPAATLSGDVPMAPAQSVRITPSSRS